MGEERNTIRRLQIVKSCRVLLAVALILLLSSQARAGLSLFVVPIKVQLELKPGTVKTVDMTVSNHGEDELHIVSSVMDYVYKPDGTKVFNKAGSTKLSCANWVSLNPNEFDLAGSKTQVVRCTIEVPPEATGSTNAVVFFQTRPIRSKNAGGVAVSLRVGSLLLLEAEGTVTRSGKIIDMNVDTKSAKKPPQVAVTFQNTGNGYVQLHGKLEVKDLSGKVVSDDPFPEVTVLPADKRIIIIEPKTKLPPGKYTARTTVDYGGPKLVAGEVSFSVPKR